MKVLETVKPDKYLKPNVVMVWHAIQGGVAVFSCNNIITSTISSAAIGTLAALFFTNYFTVVWLDSVIRQLAAIGQLKQPIILYLLS